MTDDSPTLAEDGPRAVALAALDEGRFDQAAASALVALAIELPRIRYELGLILDRLAIIARNLDDPAAGRP